MRQTIMGSMRGELREYAINLEKQLIDHLDELKRMANGWIPPPPQDENFDSLGSNQHDYDYDGEYDDDDYDGEYDDDDNEDFDSTSNSASRMLVRRSSRISSTSKGEG